MRDYLHDSPNQLAALLENTSQHKIVIVGDIVADCFLYGAISRVSREAPVFILRHEQTDTLPGGAANAALNVAALGAKSVLLGIVGSDKTGEDVLQKLQQLKVETNFLLQSPDWKTTTKTRIFAGQQHAPRQQVIRVDYENEALINENSQTQLIENFRDATRDADAVIISDYNYGVTGNFLLEELRELKRKSEVPVFVDSRFRLADFAGATAVTPNQDEIEQLAQKRFNNLKELEVECQRLREKLDFEALLVTRGKDGMMLFEREKSQVAHLEAIGSLDPVDVTGAGDTVMAAFALSIAAGASFLQAAQIANHAGGLVVMKRGTATVTKDELISSILNQTNKQN